MAKPQGVDLVDRLRLINHHRGKALGLAGAIAADPMLTRTIDGASTLEVILDDTHRDIVRSRMFGTRSYAQAAGVNWELVAMSKSGDQVTLTFEDAIVAQLRRKRGRLKIPAGSTTRRELALRLAREAGVEVSVDPEKRRNVARVIERSAGGKKTDSWELLGEVASDINWRRFSDGSRLVIGSDKWLLRRDKSPTVLREHTGPVHDIDFDLDQGKWVSAATLSVDANAWALPPGSVALIQQLGPANGRWLVGEFRRGLTSTRAEVSLVRQRHVLKEPRRKGRGERGETGFVPGRGGGNRGGGRASNEARERMVRFALRQSGDRYVWGGNGPDGWDCSGLVQAATAAAGKTLRKPSASQWGTCKQAGVTISVQRALGIRGALLFRIGRGNYNHVAISLGNGSTVEAMGSAYGTGVFRNAAGRGWTGAALWI